MHDADDEMTRLFRDQLKLALEQQRELNAEQRLINAKINAKLDALTEVLIEAGHPR